MGSVNEDRQAAFSPGLAIKQPVRVATTGNLAALAGLLVIDGVQLVEKDRVLVKNQANQVLNGIYSAATGSWDRTRDFDGIRDVACGTIVLVLAGTQAGQFYQVTTPDVVEPDVDNLTFVLSLTASVSTLSFLQAGAGAVPRSAQNKMRDIISVMDFGCVGDGVADDTADIIAAIATGKGILFPTGFTFKISDVLALNSNQMVLIEDGATINQVTADKGVFKATTKDRVNIINHGLLFGPGVWSAAWVGNGGHNEEGVQFLGCTRSSVTGEGVIRNFGHAQISCWGGQFNRFRQKLEGTNGYGSALALFDNFQMGFFCADDDTYGILDGILCDCDISGTAQGIVREWRRAAGGNGGTLTIRGNIHDIPGQHATYIQTGNLDAIYTVNHIALSACKIACNGPQAVTDCSAIVNGQNIGSHLFEVSNAGAGLMSNIQLRGTGDTVGGLGLSILNAMTNVQADIIVSNASGGFQAQGPNQTDIRVRVNGINMATDGVLIVSTNSDFKIWPTFRQCNTGNTAKSGLRVSSASATVDFYDPDVTDNGAKMVYGLFNETAGSIVRVHGSAKFTGATDTAVRATGVISEWPTENTLQGTNGDFTSQANVYSSQMMITRVTSTGAGNVILWARLLDDESAYMVSVEIVGKLAGSAERACYKETALFFRNGGGVATQQGATDTDVSIASGGFAGAHLLQVDGGNGIDIVVNSGGVATYDWQARTRVIKLSP